MPIPSRRDLPGWGELLINREMSRFTSPLVKAFATGRPGWGGGLLYALMVVVGGWAALMPVSNKVARATMLRMHLRAPNFPLWAVQQISPAMYNFSNRALQGPEDAPLAGLTVFEEHAGRYFNHFPVRDLTWTERQQYVPAGIYGYLQSSYQGTTLRSKYHLEPRPEGGWSLRWQDSAFTP